MAKGVCLLDCLFAIVLSVLPCLLVKKLMSFSLFAELKEQNLISCPNEVCFLAIFSIALLESSFILKGM